MGKNKFHYKNLAIPLLFVAVIFLFFHRIFFKQNFLWGDFMHYYFPMKFYIYPILKTSSIPLWNPYIFSGYPIIADIQNAFFYPLNLLMVPLWKNIMSSDYLLLEIQVIFHLFLAGISMYFLARYFKLKRSASVISGVIFAFSGPLIAHLQHPNILYSIIWLPLIFLCFHRALNKRKSVDIILAGVLLGISTLGGHPQMTYYIILFLGLYFIYKILSDFLSIKNDSSKKVKGLLHLIRSFILIIVIAFALASVELIPFWEFSQLSMRNAANYNFAASYSLPPDHFFITSFLPHFLGGQSDAAPYLGAWQYWELYSYMGIFSLVLALFGIIFHLKKSKIVRFLFVSIILSLLLAFGSYSLLHRILYHLLWGFGLFRVPARFLFFYSFAIAILAGFGANFLFQNIRKTEMNSIFAKIVKVLPECFTALLSFLLVLSIFYISSKTQIILKAVLANYLVFIFLSLSFIILLRMGLKQKITLKFLKFSILSLIIIDLFLAGWQFNNGHTNPGEYYKETPAIKFLRSQNINSFRVMAQRSLFPNFGNIYQISQTEGWTALVLRRYWNFARLYFVPDFAFNSDLEGNRLNLLNVKYIVSPDVPADEFSEIKANLYENPNALPRTFIVRQVKIIAQPEKVLDEIDKPEFDPKKEIILEELPATLAKIKPPQNDQDEEEVKIIKYTPHYIKINASLAHPGMLFLSEKYYPGWEAYVNGEKQTIYRANYLFRALYLDKGTHKIEFIFRPKSFAIGAIISLLTLLTLIIFLLCKSIFTKRQ